MGKRGKIHKLVIVWLILVLTGSTAFAGVCQEGQIELRGEWGSARFTVEVADTASERSQGLMNRPSMAKSAGMLFVYEDENDVMMWMKNTYLPLDMLFLNSEGKIVYIEENTTPLSTRTISSGRNVIGVLELNAGTALRLGIKAGDIANHHLLQQ